MTTMQLTKHHGLGNDFLVVLDLDGTRPVGPDEVVAICDRTTGVGADGLIHASRGVDTDLVMVLRNANGSRAEMSGNGISCLGQAAVLAGVVDGSKLTVATDAGLKSVEILARPGESVHTVRSDVGVVAVGDEAPEWVEGGVLRALRVDAGNPHLVLHVADHDDVDLEKLGRHANEVVPGGVNVETVTAGDDPHHVTMRVYERGVGRTDACGTGACASAAAAFRWSLASQRVTVHQPGGPATVELGPTTAYTVDVEAIARIEWPWR